MIGKDELNSFKQMWTWLSAHPAHDTNYYLANVLKGGSTWKNSCPLANSSNLEECSGCKALWSEGKANLCTDPDGPFVKWLNTAKEQPDMRTYYAIQLAVLAMNLGHRLKRQEKRFVLRRAA